MARRAPKKKAAGEASAFVVELWDIERLRPFEGNSKMHPPAQVARLAKSLERFGFKKPIVARPSDGCVIAGHGILEAAVSLGLKRVPVHPEEIPDTEMRAYVIADNKLAEGSTWNIDILRDEILALRDEDFELPMLGFSESEILSLVDPDADKTERKEDIVDYEYRVVVTCAGEQQQGELAERLEAEGFKCQLLIL